MARTLTLAFNPSSERVSASRFVRALGGVLKVLDAVDHALHQEPERDAWMIEKLESSVPMVTLRPRRKDGDITGIIIHGVSAISGANDYPPPYFTEGALQRLNALKAYLGPQGSLASIGIGSGGDSKASITAATAINAERILQKGYTNLGSIKGRLDAINVHRDPVATLWDRVTGAPVRFTFRRDDIDTVKSLVAHDVLVSGAVTYFGNGTPRSIQNVVGIEDVSRVMYAESATFGSVPDRAVRESGADVLLESLWTTKTQ